MVSFDEFDTGNQYPAKQEEKPVIPYAEYGEPNALKIKTVYDSANYAVLQSNLGNCLQIIDDEVMKGYITRLDRMEIVPPDFEKLKDIQFFKITELVYDKEEFSSYKFSTMFHTLSNKPCTLVLMIQGTGKSTNFYLGVRSRIKDSATDRMRDMLENSLKSQFPGTNVEFYGSDALAEDLSKINFSSVSCVTSIADYKQQDKQFVKNNEFVQGLEKFVNCMDRKVYTAFIIADNISHDDLMNLRQDYENIYTQISPFADMQFNFSNSENKGTSDGVSNGVAASESRGSQSTDGTNYGFSESDTHGTSESKGYSDTDSTNQSVSRGKTSTKGYSDTKSKSVSNAHSEGSSISNSTSVSKSVGVKAGIEGFGVSSSTSVSNSTSVSRFSSDTKTTTYGTSKSESFSESISKTLTEGTGQAHSDTYSSGENKSKTNTVSSGYTESRGTNYSVSETFNFVNSKTFTNTFGSSKAITLNAKNKTLNLMLNRIEKHLERIDECESIGMWNCAAYFIGEYADTETAANTYQSLISGTKSGIERSAVNSWTNEDDVSVLEEYLKNFVHPRFRYNGVRTFSEVTPAAMVSTNELTLHMGLPRKSVCGLPVIEHAEFGKEVVKSKLLQDNSDSFLIGQIFNMGSVSDIDVCLSRNSMAMHTFITGSTGSGKSNTVCKILDEARKSGAKFLVIEPAKGEYKDVFGMCEDVSVYGTNPALTPLLRIDPFSFPNGIHILEHLDRLVEIFNACWPMYAAMPAVLKSAVEKAYAECGWDLTESCNSYGDNLYPNLADVARNVKMIIDSSEYDTDNKGAYKGSLLTRLNSLTNGINGMIFTDTEIHDDKLFDENVIVDLSRVGSTETKSLIMGMLILKLQEYRMTSSESNSALKHITVLEEAHNLLKRTSSEQQTETANLTGKSVEMLSNAIAEMRTYGEGFIIADQAPGLLDMAVIRNTNTKIIMRLPDSSDRELVGKAANLNENQIDELAKLPLGVAAIYQNEWIQPVLCKVGMHKQQDKKYSYEHRKALPEKDLSQTRLKIAELLCRGTAVGNETVIKEIRPQLEELKLNASVQTSVIRLLLNPPEETRMTRLAPIMSAIFPTVRSAVVLSYNENCEAEQWTRSAEKALAECVKVNIDGQVRRDIIQAVVTDYIFVELNKIDVLREWSIKGGLR